MSYNVPGSNKVEPPPHLNRNLFSNLEKLIEISEVDYHKAFKGNRNAGRRVRSNMRKAKKVVIQIVQDMLALDKHFSKG